MGRLKPDHKTISEFRRHNKKAIKKILKQCVRLCLRLGLIEGNTLFVDSTKIRANASINKSYTKAKYDKMLSKTDKRIEEILDECEKIDQGEKDKDSLVKMKKELSDKEQLKSKIENILNEFNEQGSRTRDGKERKKNLTDPECKNMRSAQGTHASYNVQSVVDGKNSLIVNVDTVSDTSDQNQFSQQIKKAEEVTKQECKTACSDAGYSNVENLEEIYKRGTKVVVPSQRQALHGEEKPFSKSKFKYNKKEDCYYCPEGKKLKYNGVKERGKKIVYKIEDAKTCKQCGHYGICTKSKTGRQVVRLKKEELKEKLEKEYEKKESQEIYKRRKSSIEHPFGHIKRNLGMRSFLLKGIEGGQTEIVTAATCFNVVRMITLLGGVQKFIAVIQQINI